MIRDEAATGTARSTGRTQRDGYPGPTSMVRSAAASWRTAYGAFTGLLLLGLALSPPGGVGWPLAVVSVFGLVLPTLRARWWYWVVLGATFLIAVASVPVTEWDNHRFLQAYVLTALVVARLGTDPERHLATTARVLVGLVFLFATMWKAASPGFVDGGFYAYTASSDPRLGQVMVALDLQDAEIGRRNREARATWRDPSAEPAPLDLEVSVAVDRLAQPLAKATLVIEGSVAVLFLAPLRGRYRRWRDVVMVTFVVTTYPIAPVVSFGYTLVALSAMQSGLPPPLRTRVYVATFGLLVALSYRGPMLALLGFEG